MATAAAFFDLDKTVIARASLVAFGRSFYKEGLIGRRTIMRALWGQLVYLHLGASEEKLARMRESVLALTKGWERQRIVDIVEDALSTVVEPIIYAEALQAMADHRSAGRLVVIVSASPTEIVEPIGRLLGVDIVIASRPEVGGDGRYTGQMSLYAYGPQKAEAMQALARQHGIDLGASYSYSDSFTDLPMLEVVGHPVAVNPDRPLARVARERGWEVTTFAEPVRLRDRIPAPPAPATGVAAGLIALGVGAYLWWRFAGRRSQAAPQLQRPKTPNVAGLARRLRLSGGR